MNRNPYNIAGRQMDVFTAPGMRYFDLYHGVELKPQIEGPLAVLSFDLEAHGYGAILATPGEPKRQNQSAAAPHGRDDEEAAGKTSRMSGRCCRSRSSPLHRPKPATEAPAGMVRIPGGEFVFRVRGTEIEGSADNGVDVQYPWEDSPRRFHEHTMQIKPFYIDKYPVTNAQFKEFLDATHYAPRDKINFLRDWKNGTFPQGGTAGR